MYDLEFCWKLALVSGVHSPMFLYSHLHDIARISGKLCCYLIMLLDIKIETKIFNVAQKLMETMELKCWCKGP